LTAIIDDTIDDTKDDTSMIRPINKHRGYFAISVVALSWVLVMSALVPGRALADDHHSVARDWNEALLFAIRIDFARPTVHARNLFHTSAAMFDAWAVFDEVASPYFLGRVQNNGSACPLTDEQRQRYRAVEDISAARHEAISFAMYRLLSARFVNSPGQTDSQAYFDNLLADSGYLSSNESTDIDSASAASLGNYIARCVIDFGFNDGSNERNEYDNRAYSSINPPLNPNFTGNPDLEDPDRWQPLLLDSFVDQAGNPTDTPVFLSAEWGDVVPFSLKESDATVFNRNGQSYRLYFDPGPPARLNDGLSTGSDYLWGHALVAMWSSHLDPSDGVLWDISPANTGNSAELPTSIRELQRFYNAADGGAAESGHSLNPVTGIPYEPNLVPRGDYTRVLAEFWADGPDSETPPGHWFTIYNSAVVDHPEFEKRFEGVGDILDDLEFDIRSYFLLGGAMHDAAVAAWGAKGWYDYIRPVSALRYMAGKGQSSDPSADYYHEHGVPLVDGFLEIISVGDVLAGNGNANVGKIKVRAWRGPSFIGNPNTELAGVGWVLLENWWPYQRPTFVTPPFAGYVSGHSTFSRAAAEVLTKLTGSEFFPGGMAEFTARENSFLVFENGPSTDVVLQWATYRDASDQTSLSRIWGGIHPPVDDIPGRRLGIQVAESVYQKASAYFDGSVADQNTAATSSGNGCSISKRVGRHGYDPTLLLIMLLSAITALLRMRMQKKQTISLPHRSR